MLAFTKTFDSEPIKVAIDFVVEEVANEPGLLALELSDDLVIARLGQAKVEERPGDEDQGNDNLDQLGHRRETEGRHFD